MDYFKTLDTLSSYIFDQENKKNTELTSLISENTLSNIEVYRRNIFGTLLKSLSEDFQATHKYLGEKNFKFMVRAYFIENKISSPNIFDASKNFPHFLNKQYDLHQDELIEHLATIDLFWSQQSIGHYILAPLGITQYWGALLADENTSEITVDLSKLERLGTREEYGENVLVVFTGEDYD